MLYKKTEKLEPKSFENPGAEYRGTPFWAWNTKMTEENVKFMVEIMHQMGMGGAHLHCRTGMANEYMSKEFLDLIKTANKEFTDRKMLTWLYDEDRWPSGAGGGLVTKDHANRIRFLVFSPRILDNVESKDKQLSSTGQAVRSNERTFLARYIVKITDSYLTDYKRLEEQDPVPEGYKEWFAYMEVSGDHPWFNNQAYVNTLDKKAVECFIEVTHQKYYEKLGEEFGKSIPAIFTDEPQFSHKQHFGLAVEEKEVNIPYTDDLEETFTKAYGHGLLDALPELFWELGEDKFSVIRYQYHDHICERFSSAFADTIGNWCREHGIMLTGHMMEEPTLASQTAALGEAMRSYRSFDLPGIDMLCDWRELTTAKQAQSASHQFGCPGVLSELYGVTNYMFDFRGHKMQGDWQAALGVTVRVLHLAWTSMAGEAKRDYPASICYQSPWFKEYPYIEDYFARINTALTRGKAKVKVGIIHPIESFWLYWGNDEQTGGIRQEMDEKFVNLTNWMLYGLMDFDFISESLLSIQEKEITDTKKLQVGEMAYDVIVVPNMVTIRSTTLEVLEHFAVAGGKIIFTDSIPKLADAIPSERCKKMSEGCVFIPFSRYALLKELDDYRLLDIRDDRGNRTENIIYQMRQEGEDCWLFLSHVMKAKNPDIPIPEKLTISIEGIWRPVCYDALTGEIKSVPYTIQGNKTVIRQVMFIHDSLLLKLEAGKVDLKAKLLEDSFICQLEVADKITVPDSVSVKLSEPNVVLLDIAEAKFDECEWQEKDEILRIDNKFREILGYPLRMESLAQPWVDQSMEVPEHTISLRYRVTSRICGTPVQLGLEHCHDCIITFNGETVSGEKTGWYVDMDIDVIELGSLKEGANVIEVTMPFFSKQNVEAMYLLGDFGVRLLGSTAVIEEPVRNLNFGDATVQGLAFYGGNIEYVVPMEMKQDGELSVQVSYFRSPVLKAELDDEVKGHITIAPYDLSLGQIEKGTHILKITAFGNRMNTFGALHLCDTSEDWGGPNAWRTEGSKWAYEYQIKPSGILKKPELFVK